MDKILIMVDSSINNFCLIKAILKWFEVASGLRVDFSKISLIEVNIDSDFLDLDGDFLFSNQESLPFKYLGLLVRGTPRLETDWEPLITLVSNRFRSWRNRVVSVSGRVILLNSVLNVILIFFLSFLKMQMNVWNKLVMIQTNLLWEGVKLASNISWVYLSDICKPK